MLEVTLHPEQGPVALGCERSDFMRVLFVWLNNDTPVGISHGIALLSAELKRAGHQVALLHVNEQLGTPLDAELLSARIAHHAPDVVALSFGSNHAPAAAEVARIARASQPRATIVAGGIHATLHPEEVFAWPEIDLLALGEADGDRFVTALDELALGKLPIETPGFWSRAPTGEVRMGSLAPPVDIGDQLLPKDLDLFDHRRILELKRGWADMHAGRGCPQRCSYCFNEPLRQRYIAAIQRAECDLRYVRKRPLEVVMAELRGYVVRYGKYIRAFSFTDDQFLVGRQWALDFFAAYAESIRLPLIFLATAGAINEPIVAAAARAGTYMVRMGVESGSESLRQRVLNRHTPNRVIARAIEMLQRAGINAFTFNMVGIPGETVDDAWATCRFATELGCDAVKFSNFWPYPGTALFEHCQREGLLRSDLGFMGNNTDDTPLVWPPEQQRFYRRLARFFDVALNRFRPEPEAPAFAALWNEIEHLPEPDFTDGAAAHLRTRATTLADAVVTRGGEAYVVPFPDRADILLLKGRSRTRPLLM